VSKRDDITRALMEPASAVAPSAPRPSGPMSFVARAGQQAAGGLAAEIERLKAERSAGYVILRLDPEAIGLTEFANRHELSLSSSDETFNSFKANIRLHGQDTPVRVRPAASASGAFEYELVEGHRRHAAIRQLNKEVEGGFPILARLDAKAADAKDLVLKMYRENAERKDLSAFEIGGMFAQWLRNGLYKTQREISAATHLHETTVGQYVAIAELPAEVVAAFRDPRTIAVRWSKDLSKACRDRLKLVIARASKITKAEPVPEPEAVFRALTAVPPTGDGKPRGSKLSESVKVDNKVLFTIALKGGRLTLNPRQIKETQLPELYEDLKAYAHKWLKDKGRASS
jgi:ParB family transcriptional regulator, chromosome partitioning protein